MKSFKAIFMLLIVGVMPFFAEGRVCQSKDNGQSFLDSNSRTVHWDFSNHRSPMSFEVQGLKLTLNAPIFASPGTVSLLELGSLFWQKYLAEGMKQVDRLNKLIAQEKISWVGVEMAPAELASGDLPDQYQTLKQILLNNKGSEKFANEMTLLWAGTAGLYVWGTNPQAREKVELVALEDNDLKARAIAELNESNKLFSDLTRHQPTTSLTGIKFKEIQAAYDDNLWGRKILTDRMIKKIVSGIADPELATIATNYLLTERKILATTHLRDNFDAQTIHQQKGNGFVTLGGLHQTGVTRQLKQLCLKPE